MGKLDTAMVNGPEGDVLDWDAVDWRRVEDDVRRLTERNAGRKTAGVDGRVVLGAGEKAELADWLQHDATAWSPKPVKRVFIPKANGKRRGLGIPVIADRALQALKVGALEPEWEARFESRS